MKKKRWKKKSSLSEGDMFTTKYGRTYTIGKYDQDKNVYQCVFADYNKWVEKRAISSGNIKHPEDRTVFSTGYIGHGMYNPKEHKLSYNKWVSMLKRVYSGDPHYKRSYGDVLVCDEWHSFQNFSKWFYSEDGDSSWELDKDLFYLGKEGKVKYYSAETCFLLPRSLNSTIRSFKYNPKVQKEKLKYRAYTEVGSKNTELGRFNNEINAKLIIVRTKIGILQQKLRESGINYMLDVTGLFNKCCRVIADENR